MPFFIHSQLVNQIYGPRNTIEQGILESFHFRHGEARLVSIGTFLCDHKIVSTPLCVLLVVFLPIS